MKLNKDNELELQEMDVDVLKHAATLSLEQGNLYATILAKLNNGKILITDYTENEILGMKILLNISSEYLLSLEKALGSAELKIYSSK